MPLHRSNGSSSPLRLALAGVRGLTEAVASKTSMDGQHYRYLSGFHPLCSAGLGNAHHDPATLTFISSKLSRPCILENWDPLPLASHRISFSAITRGPAIQEGRPSLSHQVPGSDLDMASNDGMMLSAFDLTILPITGKSMEPSHAEAPGHGQHQYQFGTYCGQ
ncbi:hypothetical protein BDP55DRAFT_629367 [Colletotrichum godetiae]|uniref:Uncharacterized protein n=1 Tax=Colletotrichum godetiae TaxID=1209918 RepID=A0AAJ0AR28_9PEZI|nr:uncharacterized protein BDP55DRAFT_629367 [Colletotrichum godetiae]KAK1688814.1 hypothetical protein BDP55DRAFT_629367 [Colletotrichum godetiae]